MASQIQFRQAGYSRVIGKFPQGHGLLASPLVVNSHDDHKGLQYHMFNLCYEWLFLDRTKVYGFYNATVSQQTHRWAVHHQHRDHTVITML